MMILELNVGIDIEGKEFIAFEVNDFSFPNIFY
jgi:hypothetical protein